MVEMEVKEGEMGFGYWACHGEAPCREDWCGDTLGVKGWGLRAELETRKENRENGK